VGVAGKGHYSVGVLEDAKPHGTDYEHVYIGRIQFIN
jgi:hypothetical protein